MEGAMADLTADSVEELLRAELARGDRAIASARPVLRHLLSSGDQSLFSQEVVARMRGMMLDIARQLLTSCAAEVVERDRARFVTEREEELAGALRDDAALLSHLHALALEGRLAARLQARSGIEPVLSPLLQDEIAAPDTGRAALAMATLAAQARFIQQHRRMELPLGELPGELFHQALLLLRSQAGEGDPAARAAERRLRANFDEGASRLALIARLAAGAGQHGAQALAIDQAGLAIFATALAAASGQERELAILSLGEAQIMRLALALRAAGLRDDALQAQFLILHPQAGAPEGFETLAPDHAAAMLAGSLAEAAG